MDNLLSDITIFVVDTMLSLRYLTLTLFIVTMINSYNIKTEMIKFDNEAQAQRIIESTYTNSLLSSSDLVSIIKDKYKNTPFIYNPAYTNNNFKLSTVDSQYFKPTVPYTEQINYLNLNNVKSDNYSFYFDENNNKALVEEYEKVLSDRKAVVSDKTLTLGSTSIQISEEGALSNDYNYAFYNNTISTDNLFRIFGTKAYYWITQVFNANNEFLGYYIIKARL